MQTTGIQRFEFEPPTNSLAPLSEACATTCQCKLYFPCQVTGHNPCGFEIRFDQNHTHILVEQNFNGVTRPKRVCVSPKCLGFFEDAPRASIQAPPVKCSICYYQKQVKRDARFVIGSEASSSPLLWAWRKNLYKDAR
ncbi:MAG: hypothetical protein ACYC7D_05410 [Nitrososphaerales archaeon]